MSTDAEQAHSPRGTPPPRPAHPPRTAPERPSAPPPRPANAPGFTPDPETPVLGVRAKAPFSRGTAGAPGTGVPPQPSAPPRPSAPPGTGASARTGASPRTGGLFGDLGPGGRRRPPSRTAAAAASLVLGLGLLGGAAAGSWLGDDPDAPPSTADTYAHARSAWHSVPVDDLFPRTLRGKGQGPGGADRVWTRIAVAPDSSCGGGFDPLLAKALAPVGCKRLVRATYTDATSTSVTTVGVLITTSGPTGMRALRQRFVAEKLDERTDLMPRTYAAEGTAAAGFGDDQRASWRIRILTDAPAVVYTVTGFADGREVTDPQSAGEATQRGATSAPAQSGLGNDARGIADAIEAGFRRALATYPETTS
ncbi:hypothetical protein SVIO_085540 [Streptomyces violaceusniger]|uniref:Uncharacterized protein n=1 Tax=Streptomyces violaceusniger TaxID=68280 RepID=A0A4D4L8N0_STRVO|nr:hypothetical protein SVIO_085540 [Streptomyces violaceusniger]